jgi:O-antigen ligase
MTQSIDPGAALNEVILHVGMLELVVRQGIFGAAVWAIFFIVIPLRHILKLRSLGRPVSLLPCLFLALFLIASNLTTAPPFYNEIRPAVFLGLWLGISFVDDPVTVFGAPQRARALIRQIWSRQTPEPVPA